jgi:hypothetical protein
MPHLSQGFVEGDMQHLCGPTPRMTCRFRSQTIYSGCRPIAIDWFTVHAPTASVVVLAGACGLTASNVSYVSYLRRVPAGNFGTFTSTTPSRRPGPGRSSSSRPLKQTIGKVLG